MSRTVLDAGYIAPAGKRFTVFAALDALARPKAALCDFFENPCGIQRPVAGYLKVGRRAANDIRLRESRERRERRIDCDNAVLRVAYDNSLSRVLKNFGR